MVDTPVPVIGAVRGAKEDGPYDPSWPAVFHDDRPYTGGFGPAPQWADDSDDTYGTAIWHGETYEFTQDPLAETGMWTTAWCDIAPVKVPSDVYGITVRMRARVRPSSPPELAAWSGPPFGGPAHRLHFAVYNINPDPPGDFTSATIAASSLSLGGPQEPGWTSDVPAGTKFWWPMSWEPSWQELYIPANAWDMKTQVWDEDLQEYVDTDESLPGARQLLTDAFRYGARIMVACPNASFASGNTPRFEKPYDEIWADIYEVQIVAHSTEIGVAPAGQARAFKGARR